MSKSLKEQAFESYSLLSDLKAIVIILSILGYVLYELYGMASEQNLILFFVLTAVVLIAFIFCFYLAMKKRMKFADLLGNVFTVGLVVYLGLFFVLKSLPN